MAIKTEKKEKITIQREARSNMPLLRNNFLLMIIAGVLIIVGFALVAGGGSSINEYNPDIFSTRRIVVGPMLAFFGFVLMGIGIIVKPKGKVD